MKNILVVLALFSALPPPLDSGIPLEVLVDGADLIVAGQVTDIKPGFPPFDNAVVKVTKVMKSLPGFGQPKTVVIAQPAAQSPLTVSTSLNRFSVGQEGIWFLTRDPGHQAFWAKHPNHFRPNQVKVQVQVAELVKTRAKLPEGKAVNGLVARAEIGQQMPAADFPNYAATNNEVRFSLKNVSEKPITICNFPGHQPLKVDWAGPKGQLKSGHYQGVAKAKLVLTKDSFVTIPPGGVRFIGPRAGEAGIWFQAPLAPAGQHRITISFSFANPEEGKQLQIGNVWTGTVTANEVRFETRE